MPPDLRSLLRRVSDFGKPPTAGENTLIDPEDLIQRLSVEELCATAETYFKSINDPTFQMAKPYCSFDEAPKSLENMGLLLSGLKLAKTMSVLDFGAGTCWLSRILSQMGCQTIACDPSPTALEIGRRLFAEAPAIGGHLYEPTFMVFDGHRVDAPDNSIDRIICFDTFHHIPNQEEVLAEFLRILKPGGIAGFSEPGRHHSQTAASQYEMQHYTVLENDIDLNAIWAIASRLGFAQFSYKIMRYGDMTLQDYNDLIALGSNIAKPLSVAERILKNISQEMINKSIFFLFKDRDFAADSRRAEGLAYAMSIAAGEYSVGKGDTLALSLNIKNTGNATWLMDNAHYFGVVKVGTHLYDQRGELLDYEFSRHSLAANVAPDASVDLTIALKFNGVGRFVLVIDMVSELVTWFEQVGSKPLRVHISVE